jgi:hypothetical protein
MEKRGAGTNFAKKGPEGSVKAVIMMMRMMRQVR